MICEAVSVSLAHVDSLRWIAKPCEIVSKGLLLSNVHASGTTMPHNAYLNILW